MSLTSGYVVPPHDDSGASNESILFACRDPMPAGHEWLFAVAGFILELPKAKGEAVHVAVPGCGVFHGTLPSSSTQPHHHHGNLGAALVTGKQLIQAVDKQRARGETTPDKYTASHMYGVTTKPSLLGRVVGYVSGGVGTKRKCVSSAAPSTKLPRTSAGGSKKKHATLSAQVAPMQQSRRSSSHPFLGKRVSTIFNGTLYSATATEFWPASLGKEALIRLEFDRDRPGGRCVGWCPESSVSVIC